MAAALIDTPAELAECAARWAHASWLAIDTEFVRVDTYYPKLCLIQIADGADSRCIDVLGLAELAPLFELLHDPRITCVIHAASQDLEILVQTAPRHSAPEATAGGRVIGTLFDTQIAATLLGVGDQIGYAGLVEKRLGLAVDKSLARTDWSRRPLAEKEIAYATDDVRHLAQIYPALREELERRGRLAWLEEDCARMNVAEHYRTHPQDAWQRLKGLQRLPPRAQTIAAKLAAWRETQAMKRDRPRKWILDDEPIYKLALRAPRTPAELEALQALPPRTLERHGRALLESIAEAQDEPPKMLARIEELSPAETVLLKKLQTAAQERAASLGVPASYLVSRSDLGKLLREREAADLALLKGWRREVAGEDLLKLL